MSSYSICEEANLKKRQTNTEVSFVTNKEVSFELEKAEKEVFMRPNYC